MYALAPRKVITEPYDVVNERGEMSFRVFNENKILVLNQHRGPLTTATNIDTSPYVKFELNGTAVTKVVQSTKDPSVYSLELEEPLFQEAGSVQIRIIEKAAHNVTEFEFHWSGADDELVRQHQVCFYYAYNRVSW